MSVERTWTRIYVDRMKLTSISGYLGRGKKSGELGVGGWMRGPRPEKFDLEQVFAKLPAHDIISDRSIDEIIDKIASLKKYESPGDLVNRLLHNPASSGTPKGELVMIEAATSVEEGMSLPRPDGRFMPLLKQGSYLAYRKPFDKLLLFDGTYHTGVLFDFDDTADFDILKVYIKEGDGLDPSALLGSWDPSHARIIGLLGACSPYRCRFNHLKREDLESRISFGVFALVIDVSPFDNLDVAERMSFWRAV